MKWKLFAMCLLITGVLAACGEENKKVEDSAVTVVGEKTNEINEPVVTQGQTDNIKELVESYSANKQTDEKASITSRQLIVTDIKNNETVYDLPEDEFFVSIAPYINETHPCKDHSLTGCQGELVGQEIDVFIENEKGEIIVDEKLTTLENGFIDLWLPRNEAFIIQMEYDGKKVEGDLATFDEDGTCVTTLQLL